MKTANAAFKAKKLASTHDESEKALEPGKDLEAEPICFPAIPDALTGATGIGLVGVLAGRRLKLGGRVLTGSWRRKDGTVTHRYSRWVEYTRLVEGVPMAGIDLVPEREIAVVMSFAAFARRKTA